MKGERRRGRERYWEQCAWQAGQAGKIGQLFCYIANAQVHLISQRRLLSFLKLTAGASQTSTKQGLLVSVVNIHFRQHDCRQAVWSMRISIHQRNVSRASCWKTYVFTRCLWLVKSLQVIAASVWYILVTSKMTKTCAVSIMSLCCHQTSSNVAHWNVRFRPELVVSEGTHVNFLAKGSFCVLWPWVTLNTAAFRNPLDGYVESPKAVCF